MQQLASFLILATLVFYSKSVAAQSCHGTLLDSGITEEDKVVILREHNRLRQLVATGRFPGQPGAENMREIVWDNELALRAQQWANNCQFRHDPHRTINRFTMGQNLAVIWSTVPLDANDGDFPSRIQAWFNEVQKYSFGDAWSPKTGHYSQLVWGETSLIGCGYSEYKDSTKYNKLYVCNYGPGGNVVGFNPYEVGKPSCSAYGLRSSSRYQGLCAAPNTQSNDVNSNTIETYEYKQTTTNDFNPNQSSFPTQNPQYSYSLHPKQANPFAKASPDYALPVATAYGSKAASFASGYTSQQKTQIQQKLQSKLEAFKQSAAHFEKSVRKHTAFKTYVSQQDDATAAAENQQQQLQAQPKVQYVQFTTPRSTSKPGTRGWSLLTWRG